MSTPIVETAGGQEPAAERCGQCGAAAAPDQRYCISCGFHRRNAPDPVARYLSEASAALARVAAANALAAQRRRVPTVGARLAIGLIVIALLAGIVIGNAMSRGSSGGAAATMTDRRGHTRPAQRHGTRVRNATGSSYMQQEQNLPNSVTP